MKSLLLGTILGGLVAFVWSSISWEMIGWHEKTLVRFQNEDEVSAVIASHTPVDGTYLLPAGPSTDGMAPDQKKAVQAATMEKMQKGPIMFGDRASRRIWVLHARLDCPAVESDGRCIPADVVAAANKRTKLRPKRCIPCDRRPFGERNYRSTQLELVGIFRSLHSRESCRLDDNLADCRDCDRKSRKTKNNLVLPLRFLASCG